MDKSSRRAAPFSGGAHMFFNTEGSGTGTGSGSGGAHGLIILCAIRAHGTGICAHVVRWLWRTAIEFVRTVCVLFR